MGFFEAAVGGAISGLTSGGGTSRTDAAIASNRQFQYQRELDRLARINNDRWNDVARRHANLNRAEAQRQYNLSYNQANKQFYQAHTQAIQARVADAKKAGIHPLYALGAASASGSVASPASASAFIPGQSASGGGMSAVLSDEPAGYDYGGIAAEAYRAFQKRSKSARMTRAQQTAYELAVQRANLGAMAARAQLDKDQATLAAARADEIRRRLANEQKNQDGNGRVQQTVTAPEDASSLGMQTRRIKTRPGERPGSMSTPERAILQMGGQNIDFPPGWSPAEAGTNLVGEPYEWITAPYVMSRAIRDHYQKPGAWARTFKTRGSSMKPKPNQRSRKRSRNRR